MLAETVMPDDSNLVELAWRAGQNAARDGLPSNSNAHQAQSTLALAWASGWRHGERQRWLHLQSRSALSE